MKFLYSIIVVFSIVLLAGCAEKLEESNSKYIEELQEKASVIGQRELERFNAADLIYKNIPEFHSTIIPIMNKKRSIWVKTYRKYTGFSVLDISQSSSFISPILYEIEYKYTQFSTSYRVIGDRENAQQLSLEDSQFSLILSDSFTRQYLCNKEGDLTGSLPPLPIRPDYFQSSYGSKVVFDIN